MLPLALWASLVSAQELPEATSQMEITRQVAAADQVVLATVGSVAPNVFYDADGMLNVTTIVSLNVQRSLKGDAGAVEELHLGGGEYNGGWVIVDRSPDPRIFRVDDTVLCLTTRRTDGRLSPIPWRSSCMLSRADAHGQEAAMDAQGFAVNSLRPYETTPWSVADPNGIVQNPAAGVIPAAPMTWDATVALIESEIAGVTP